MFQVTVTLPVKRNDGYDNGVAITAIEQEIAKTYGGFTHQNVSGGWFDSDTGLFYADESTQVYTFVETEEAVEALLRRAEVWALWLEQIELLVTISEVSPHFIKGVRRPIAA